ncbi:MAG: molybdopterin-dependent oxidoreductase [Candidatus Thermoplasmatota archaeon]|nr:molybdopterin-dependent oxidoreductase [Candidatus Thermoplasmatota archaeon]
MNNKTVYILIIIFYLIFLNFIGCIDNNIILDSVEIRDYKGEKLSSINDFRENSIKGPQYIDRENYTLKITGLIENQKNYSYAEILEKFQSYEKVVTLFCVEGWNTKILWEGILINDILEEVQPTSDAEIIIFHAYDGYTTSLSLDFIKKNNLILAYKMNNVTLPPERGFPFQLVAESKWGYKWIKWITEIELSDDANYRGYWESRGYSNSADLDKSFFGD